MKNGIAHIRTIDNYYTLDKVYRYEPNSAYVRQFMNWVNEQGGLSAFPSQYAAYIGLFDQHRLPNGLTWLDDSVFSDNSFVEQLFNGFPDICNATNNEVVATIRAQILSLTDNWSKSAFFTMLLDNYVCFVLVLYFGNFKNITPEAQRMIKAKTNALQNFQSAMQQHNARLASQSSSWYMNLLKPVINILAPILGVVGLGSLSDLLGATNGTLNTLTYTSPDGTQVQLGKASLFSTGNILLGVGILGAAVAIFKGKRKGK